MNTVVSRILVSALLLIFASAASAQDTYRPAEQRVVCVETGDTANVYGSVTGVAQKQIPNGTPVHVRDFMFGEDATGYFLVVYGPENAGQSQTGFVRADDLKNFCGYDARRNVTRQQFRAPPNTCHLIGASRRTVAEVNDFAETHRAFFPSMEVYLADNGWYAISLGLIRVDAENIVRSATAGIPEDAYCSDGNGYIAVLEKLQDRFQTIDLPVFESLDAQFDAARALRQDGEKTENRDLFKRACDLGDWMACGRYSHAITSNADPEDDEIIQRNHFDLLGCMRGARVDCNNLFAMRRSYVDHLLSAPRWQSTDEVWPRVQDELARTACDGGVWPSCRYLAENLWDSDPIDPVKYAMATQAMYTACLNVGGADDRICRVSAEMLDYKRFRLGIDPDPLDMFVVGQINAPNCNHNPSIAWASCGTAYDAYKSFLAANVGTPTMQVAARDFLVDGCEVGDSDACAALEAAAATNVMPSSMRTSDILRSDATAYVCNPDSTFTNMRNLPTASGSVVLAELPNALRVRIVKNVFNAAGFLYYEISLSGFDDIAVNRRTGYVYHAAIDTYCNRPAELTRAIVALAQRLASQNPGLSASSISDVNADFDGTTLRLMNLPGIRDISALAGADQLTFLDLSYTSVDDLSALDGVKTLETLSLYETKVTDIAPLADMTGLRTLNLRWTNVEDLSPLADLIDLEMLYLPNDAARDDAVVRMLIKNGLRTD